ncbi:hypothetical protein QE152_g30583 [Popillia japonica]|uniref:Uncharacterized protein n=1 Tax=Popillia japonica TaxID=7064 RepID=A0AAW1JEE5_POPJA
MLATIDLPPTITPGSTERPPSLSQSSRQQQTSPFSPALQPLQSCPTPVSTIPTTTTPPPTLAVDAPPAVCEGKKKRRSSPLDQPPAVNAHRLEYSGQSSTRGSQLRRRSDTIKAMTPRRTQLSRTWLEASRCRCPHISRSLPLTSSTSGGADYVYLCFLYFYTY